MCLLINSSNNNKRTSVEMYHKTIVHIKSRRGHSSHSSTGHKTKPISSPQRRLCVGDGVVAVHHTAPRRPPACRHCQKMFRLQNTRRGNAIKIEFRRIPGRLAANLGGVSQNAAAVNLQPKLCMLLLATVQPLSPIIA